MVGGLESGSGEGPARFIGSVIPHTMLPLTETVAVRCVTTTGIFVLRMFVRGRVDMFVFDGIFGT